MAPEAKPHFGSFEEAAGTRKSQRPSRRGFIGQLSATALCAGAGTTTWKSSDTGGHTLRDEPRDNQRLERAFEIRQHAAVADRHVKMPDQISNGDELRHENRVGSYTKGLPHNNIGIVDPSAYDAFVAAATSRNSAEFDLVPLGGVVPLANPQAGLTFCLEGLDSHQFKLPPAPAFASAERAGEAVECYWMALLRDTNFSDYETNPTVLAACDELSKLTDFRGPRTSGKVTPATLFRGFTAGDRIGPYLSQFLLQPVNYGTIPLSHAINTYLPLLSGGSDYMTDATSWLAVQNGQGPFAKNRIDPTPRHIRNGRDLSAYVHIDPSYQAFLNASLWFNDHKVPVNPGNPYKTSRNQSGFSTFGPPHVQGMLGLASILALRAVWYQKWFVHRTLRPEEFGGHVHFSLSGSTSYPIHADVLKSKAITQVYSQNGSYLLPLAYPEGSPQHPSYAQGHGAIAGACTTVLKAFFDGNQPIQEFSDVFVPSTDGASLVSYIGHDTDRMTINSELDKLASNIGIGRNHAAVHWRSDYVEGLRLGEAVAIAAIRDEQECFTEDLHGLTFRKFDGTELTI